ncbi:hypothetical protein Apa02nite_008000 [Actinoplanes palleronii]|uniref:Uncharacterized protein n=1 Tax=Actinoplanes palleronii TaxID=113570 RepID=A0ABQ4B2A1_9ACTN|nr:hypothetical protein Apa02nite_008000 [Actinoplanes palleronii]
MNGFKHVEAGDVATRTVSRWTASTLRDHVGQGPLWACTGMRWASLSNCNDTTATPVGADPAPAQLPKP